MGNVSKGDTSQFALQMILIKTVLSL